MYGTLLQQQKYSSTDYATVHSLTSVFKHFQFGLQRQWHVALKHTIPPLTQQGDGPANKVKNRKSNKSIAYNSGSSDAFVIGVGTQQVNVGFDNTLPIVKSITMS